MKYDGFGFLPKIHFFIFLKKNFLDLFSSSINICSSETGYVHKVVGPGTQRICNTFCRPLIVAARAQARHAVAPILNQLLCGLWPNVLFQSKPCRPCEPLALFQFMNGFSACSNFAQGQGSFDMFSLTNS